MGFLDKFFAGLKVAKAAEQAEYENQYGEELDLTEDEKKALPVDGTAYIEEKYNQEISTDEKRKRMRESYKAEVNEEKAGQKARKTARTNSDNQRAQE